MSASAGSSIAEDSTPPTLAPTTVLIVEDEILFFLEAKETLRAHGYHVIGPATTVEKALSLLEQERPDVVLLDVNLKGEWSTPVAGVLREAGIPYLVTSSYSPSALEATGILDGTRNLGKLAEENLLIRALSELTKRS